MAAAQRERDPGYLCRVPDRLIEVHDHTVMMLDFSAPYYRRHALNDPRMKTQTLEKQHGTRK